MNTFNDNIPLHERSLKGGNSEIKPWSGFSPSAFIANPTTSIFVKCQIIALWTVLIVFIIVAWYGHSQAKRKPNYRRMNPISKTLESAAEGFTKLLN